jgi:hypothetical protein
MLFGIVAAGKLHSQPYILIFDKENKPDFT